MNNNKKGIRSLRTKLFDLLTVVLVVAVLALNLLMPGLGLRKSLYVDLTPEGLYSLTDAMIRECSFVDDLEGDHFYVTGFPKGVSLEDVGVSIYFGKIGGFAVFVIQFNVEITGGDYVVI